MSRNLTRADCAECPGAHEHIVLEEKPRPVSKDDLGEYYWSTGNYAGLIVAHARCVLCHTLYLAWVDWPSTAHGWWRLKDKPGGHRFVDLSYRHAFNDEPYVLDLPVYEVEEVRTYVRRPIHKHWYLDDRNPDDRKKYEARVQATIDAKMSVADELAVLSNSTVGGTK